MPKKQFDRTILVVDDAELILKTARAMLRDLGYKSVLSANDGDAAWDLIATGSVDVVICDWNMPRLSGIEVLRKVRSTPEFKTLPFIMLTAEAEEKAVLTAIQGGVTDYIVKPFTKNTLALKLNRITAAP